MSVPGVQTWLGTINPAYAKDDAKAKMILEEYEFTTELRTASVERPRAIGFKAGAAAAIVDKIHGDKVQEQAEQGGGAEMGAPLGADGARSPISGASLSNVTPSQAAMAQARLS